MIKIKKKKISLYYNNSFLKKLCYFYRNNIVKNNILNINTYYWLYRTIYYRSFQGLSLRIKKNFYKNNESLLIFYKYRNVRVNQVFFLNSPFLLVIKKKKSRSFTKLYLIK